MVGKPWSRMSDEEKRKERERLDRAGVPRIRKPKKIVLTEEETESLKTILNNEIDHLKNIISRLAELLDWLNEL